MIGTLAVAGAGQARQTSIPLSLRSSIGSTPGPLDPRRPDRASSPSPGRVTHAAGAKWKNHSQGAIISPSIRDWEACPLSPAPPVVSRAAVSHMVTWRRNTDSAMLVACRRLPSTFLAMTEVRDGRCFWGFHHKVSRCGHRVVEVVDRLPAPDPHPARHRAQQRLEANGPSRSPSAHFGQRDRARLQVEFEQRHALEIFLNNRDRSTTLDFSSRRRCRANRPPGARRAIWTPLSSRFRRRPAIVVSTTWGPSISSGRGSRIADRMLSLADIW